MARLILVAGVRTPSWVIVVVIVIIGVPSSLLDEAIFPARAPFHATRLPLAACAKATFICVVAAPTAFHRAVALFFIMSPAALWCVTTSNLLVLPVTFPNIEATLTIGWFTWQQGKVRWELGPCIRRCTVHKTIVPDVRPLDWLEGWPVGDRPMEIMRRRRVVFDEAHMYEDLVPDALLPPIRLLLHDSDNGLSESLWVNTSHTRLGMSLGLAVQAHRTMCLVSRCYTRLVLIHCRAHCQLMTCSTTSRVQAWLRMPLR